MLPRAQQGSGTVKFTPSLNILILMKRPGHAGTASAQAILAGLVNFPETEGSPAPYHAQKGKCACHQSQVPGRLLEACICASVWTYGTACNCACIQELPACSFLQVPVRQLVAELPCLAICSVMQLFLCRHLPLVWIRIHLLHSVSPLVLVIPFITERELTTFHCP